MDYGKRYSARKRSQWDNASRVPGWIMARKELTAGAKLCFARIANFVGGQTVAWPSQETLAEELGVSTRQVRDYLRELEAHRLIETARGGRGNPTKISLLTHPWEDGEKCPCLTCDAYDRKQSSANAYRNSSSTQKSVDRNSSSGFDRNSSSGAYKDEPYQGNPISGEVPYTLGAAYTPPTPTALQQIDRGIVAGVQLTEVAPPQNTKRPAVAVVTADFGDPPPVKQPHSPGCAIPGAAKPQTRPVEPGAGADPGSADRQERLAAIQDLRPLHQALGRYYGNVPMGTLLEEWLAFLTTQRQLGRTFTATDAETAVQRQRDLLTKLGQKPKRRFANEITPHLVDLAEEREQATQRAAAPRPAPTLPDPEPVMDFRALGDRLRAIVPGSPEFLALDSGQQRICRNLRRNAAAATAPAYH